MPGRRFSSGAAPRAASGSPPEPVGLSSHRAAPPPPVPLAGLRCRLSQRPLRVDAFSRPLLVPSRRGRRVGRAAPRPGRAEVGRERGRSKSGQAPTARDLGRAGRPGPPGHDYVLVARPGLAEPADTRGHEWLAERVTEVLDKAGAAMRSRPRHRPRLRLAVHVRAADAPEHVQVPPELLAVRARRAARARAREGVGQGRAGGCCAATRGATAGSIRRDRRRHPHPAREPAHVGADAPARLRSASPGPGRSSPSS